MGEQAANIWLTNYQLAAAMGDAYEFVPLFFLQPLLGVSEKKLHPSEEILLSASLQDPKFSTIIGVSREMNLAVRNLLDGTDDSGGVYDISHVFSDVGEPLYFDWAHVTSTGNRTVAEKIFDTLQNELCHHVPRRVGERIKAQLKKACQEGV